MDVSRVCGGSCDMHREYFSPRFRRRMPEIIYRVGLTHPIRVAYYARRRGWLSDKEVGDVPKKEVKVGVKRGEGPPPGYLRDERRAADRGLSRASGQRRDTGKPERSRLFHAAKERVGPSRSRCHQEAKRRTDAGRRQDSDAAQNAKIRERGIYAGIVGEGD